MKYVFDIDGTICSTIDGNYEESEPYLDKVEMVNKLYDEGSTIYFYTARGMRRHNLSYESARREFYWFTHRQLRSWGVKFHKLFMGKPDGDIFIDDKGVHSGRFFADEKS